MKRSIGAVLAFAVACLGGGCVSDINYCANYVHQWWTTDQAWSSRKWMYEDVPCESSFKAGFKAGYRFANCGGDSCQPPGPSHFWSAGGMTEQDQREAQAWCNGFTHGTMAAQQDGNVVVSALDAQTAKAPQGVPEVYYYPNQGAFNPNQGALNPIGSPQYESQLTASPYYPNQFSGQPFSIDQFGGTPLGQGQPVPGMMPVATQPMPIATPVPDPMSLNRGPATVPTSAACPSSAPASESLDLSLSNVGTPTTRYQGSAAFPGIGSLRSPIVENAPDAAPAAIAPNSGINAVPPVASSPPAGASLVSSPVATPTKSGAEAVPSTQPAPVIRNAPASQWEMPIIRE